MDNFKINVLSESRASFDLAMQLAFTGKWRNKTATGYIIDKVPYTVGWSSKDPDATLTVPRFVLFWADDDKVIKLPYEMDWKACANLIWPWLEKLEYPPQPGHDGSNGKGFKLYNDAWGHIEPYSWRSFLAIEPEWAWYGK